MLSTSVIRLLEQVLLRYIVSRLYVLSRCGVHLEYNEDAS